MRYIIDILNPGSLPIVKMTPGLMCMFIQEEGVLWSWSKSSSSGRFIVPMVESPIETLLDRIEEVSEKNVIVYIIKRGAFLANKVMNFLGGAIIIPPEEKPPEEADVFEWDRESVRAVLSKNHDDYDAFEQAEETITLQSIEAEWRSLRLLGTVLNEDQRQNVWDEGRFTMEAHGKTYTIVKRKHGNVFELDDSGEVEACYCVCLEEGTLYDQMMAQKLMLELDPEFFFQTANKQHRDDPIPDPIPEPDPQLRPRWSFSRMLSDAIALKAINDEWFSLCGEDPMDGLYSIQMSPR